MLVISNWRRFSHSSDLKSLSRLLPELYDKEVQSVLVLIDALTHLHNSVLIEPTVPTILFGDFISY